MNEEIYYQLIEALTDEICNSRNPSELSINVLKDIFSHDKSDMTRQIFSGYNMLGKGWLHKTLYEES